MLEQKHLKQEKFRHMPRQFNLMNTGGFFDDLDEYVYITKEIAKNFTSEEVGKT